MESAAKQNRFQELDVFRGFAVLMVVFFHFTINSPKTDFGIKMGTTGVDLFFIISGFVIYFSISKIKVGTDFVINRFSRLFPTYWASVTLTFVLLILRGMFLLHNYGEVNLGQYLANMTMLQFYLRFDHLDGPYWTLIIELIFYAFMFLLYKFKLLKYLNSIFATIIFLNLILLVYFPDSIIYRTFLFGIPFLQFVPLFFAGILFFKLFHEVENKRLIYLLLLFCLIAQLIMFKQTGRSKNFITINEYAFCLCVYFVLFLLFANKKLGFIVNPVFLFFGKISYALYLNHQFLALYFLIPLLNSFHINLVLATYGIAFPTCVLVAFLITKYVETPFNKVLRNKLNGLIRKE